MDKNKSSVEAASSPGAEYFTINYPDYFRQNPARKIMFYMRLLRRHLQEGGRLFEVGVGLGSFYRVASREYDCQGCDVNEYAVQIAIKRIPGALVRVGSCEAIPRDYSQDGIVAWDVLEHIPDIDGALQEIIARLRPGGVLIAVVPLYDGPLGWLVHLLDRDETHVSKWGRRKWLDTLKRHGYEVVEWGGIVRRLLGSYYLHMTTPQCILRVLGSAMYVVARKPANRDSLNRE